MDRSNPLGFGSTPRLTRAAGPGMEHILVQHPLRRILSFTRRSIDDVVNDPIAKNEVLGYYKLYRQIGRSGEITDLERQWNPLGTLGK